MTEHISVQRVLYRPYVGPMKLKIFFYQVIFLTIFVWLPWNELNPSFNYEKNPSWFSREIYDGHGQTYRQTVYTLNKVCNTLIDYLYFQKIAKLPIMKNFTTRGTFQPYHHPRLSPYQGRSPWCCAPPVRTWSRSYLGAVLWPGGQFLPEPNKNIRFPRKQYDRLALLLLFEKKSLYL